MVPLFYSPKKFDNPLAGARHATETIQWTYDNLIKNNHSEDLILFLEQKLAELKEQNAKLQRELEAREEVMQSLFSYFTTKSTEKERKDS